jgi:formylglycine-generating enzyme required for sulfatase activity
MDMSGNVWEWVNDWYQADYYSASPAANPQGPATGTFHVLRGGSWLYPDTFVRTAYRDFDFPSVTDNDNGFRCARTQ